jgi:UDP-N-acetylglucosamine 1-carboxyvinyltransferase
LHNVPRIRNTETLVELVRSIGVTAEWRDANTLDVCAREIRGADLDPELCARICASILLAGPLLARTGHVVLPPPGGDVVGRRQVDAHFLALEQRGTTRHRPFRCRMPSGTHRVDGVRARFKSA